jgi:N-acetylglucosamine-6-phosphate deacetylase
VLIAADGIALAGDVAPDAITTPGWVGVDAGVISEIGAGRPPRGAEVWADSVLAPGFVDLQINGIDEFDFAAVDANHAAAALERITDSGCTTCLPTLVTAPDAAYGPMLDAIAGSRHVEGAALRCHAAGAHLEGPFLGGAPGAHPIDLVRPVDLDALARWCDRHRDLVRLVTLAPEADPDLGATRALTERGITVAFGHTNATYDAVSAMIGAGASMATHLFNGMAAFHHRQPGPVGAALAHDAVTASLIADGIHVHPTAVRIAVRAKPKLALVSDAVAVDAATAGPVGFRRRAGGAAELTDGTLAGATLPIDGGVRNLVRWGVEPARALAMATSVPAEAIGLADRGRLALGFRADLVVLGRDDLRVRAVWIGGVRVR